MKSEIKCKYCGNEYEYTQYNDERGMVERHQSCPRCGHTANFLYGTGLDNTAWYEDALKYRSQKNEWISVEEQLPPYGELILVYIPTYEKTDDIHKAAFDFVWYMPDSKVFYDRETNYYYQLEHVSHWQRLQKPSKE